jgi:hypothetical protein
LICFRYCFLVVSFIALFHDWGIVRRIRRPADDRADEGVRTVIIVVYRRRTGRGDAVRARARVARAAVAVRRRSQAGVTSISIRLWIFGGVCVLFG